MKMIRNFAQRLWGWSFYPMTAYIVWDGDLKVWELYHDGRRVPGHSYENINDTVESARADGWRMNARID